MVVGRRRSLVLADKAPGRRKNVNVRMMMFNPCRYPEGTVKGSLENSIAEKGDKETKSGNKLGARAFLVLVANIVSRNESCQTRWNSPLSPRTRSKIRCRKVDGSFSGRNNLSEYLYPPVTRRPKDFIVTDIWKVGTIRNFQRDP